ncbi:flagellar motor protein MotB [Thiomicrospira microaerophila]|uniref:OmpA/MotB family protein n=1 Tax=Thiomicrospira microaerophila TaxID=406020 RepID=UPI00200DEB6D|nr:flagellar motor protein MotB [Thiomicrospira microaerophila]UQB42840.1 flagellar motor protein MotB [Thiomicrospira microaerophila]
MARRRGSGHDEGGAHGGSWKIALADLMTVLMVFFLVMWLISVVDPADRDTFVESLMGEKTSMLDQQTASILGSELNPLDLKPPVSTEEIQQAMARVDPKDIDIEDTPNYTKITLRSDSFFESGRATINDRTRLQLELLGETLAGRGQAIRITGFTDSVPINTLQFPSNWELSASRAATVGRTFIYMGVDKDLVTIEGRADNEAVAPNDNAYGRSLNRRVIIMVDKTGRPAGVSNF